MKIFIDCYPCFVRQALECARLSTDEPRLQRKVLDEVMKILISIEKFENPPQVARKVYKRIKEITGNYDPYKEIRKQDNKKMAAVYDEIREEVLKDSKSLYMACKLAAGGNAIDSGIGEARKAHGHDNIHKVLDIEPSVNDFQELKSDINNASFLLYLGDNSGEILMDKLFIEAIKKENPNLDIYYAVRGEPIINDVTLEDAENTGIGEFCKVISNGDYAPGTVLNKCSEEFIEKFNQADLIISKGQGNYETLSNIGEEKNYFVLLAKCPVIAEDIGVKKGSLVIKRTDSL